MDKVNVIRAKPLFHLSTFIMEKSEDEERINKFEDDFDEYIRRYVDRILHSSNRLQAIQLRTNALKFIDQWRLQRFEQLDQHIRTAGRLILNAFDEYQNQRQPVKCPHRLKQSPRITTIPTTTTIDTLDNQHQRKKTHEKIEISIDRLKSSTTNKKASFNSIDFGCGSTFKTIANFSSSSIDTAMTICETNTLIYSQHCNELVILSLIDSKYLLNKQLNKNLIIRDLCYVDWLHKCLVITDEEIYLLDYRTTQCDIIESGIGYICGAIDNHHHIFYLIKQSTLYKYDETSLVTLQADQYPIADGYRSRRITLDNKTNDYLALLVIANDEKNYILISSTKSLSNGYIYKILIDDRIERGWICSNGNEGWLIRGSYPGSCLDLNINGLVSVRVFDCNEIRNIIPMNEHQRFLIRTNTEIFVLIKNSF